METEGRRQASSCIRWFIISFSCRSLGFIFHTSMSYEDRRQQLIREMLLKYVASDGLKPEYNGLTAWDLAGRIIKALKEFGDFNNPQSDDKYANLSPADDIFVQGPVGDN